MWMLQLQRVGVSRLRRRDQEGGREGERERRRARCVGAHAAPTHAPMYAPASFRAARTAECWCGQRGGEGEARERETERREISSESKTSRASRDSRCTWVLLTHLYAPRHFHR